MLARDALVWRFWIICGLLTVLGGVSTPESSAQRPKYYAVPTKPADLRNNQARIKDLQRIKNRIISGGSPFNKADLDRYYQGYLLRVFTHTNQLGTLAQKRQEILGDMARARGEASNHLRGVLKGYLAKYVTNFRGMNLPQPIHPAVRFNAMLVLGDLNRAEKNIGAGRKHPTPDGDMVKFMLDELAHEDQIDAVRVAALIGLLRHAKLQHADGNPKMRMPKPTADQMIAIVNQATPPEGRSASGHNWMRRRAIEVLGALRAIGALDTYNQAIASVMNNPKENIVLRCTAAQSWALLNTTGGAQPDYKRTSLQLGALAAQCVRADLAWIDDLKLQRELKKLIEEGGTMMGGGGGGMMGGGMMGEMGAPDEMGDDMGQLMAGMGGGSIGSVPKDPELDMARRRLKYKLVSVQRGLSTLAEVDSENAEIKQVVDLVNLIMEATDTPEDEPTLEKLESQLKKNLRTLELLTASVVPDLDDPAGAAPSGAPISARPGAAPTPASVGATSTTKRGG